jgi:hypothetical protein
MVFVQSTASVDQLSVVFGNKVNVPVGGDALPSTWQSMKNRLHFFEAEKSFNFQKAEKSSLANPRIFILNTKKILPDPLQLFVTVNIGNF